MTMNSPAHKWHKLLGIQPSGCCWVPWPHSALDQIYKGLLGKAKNEKNNPQENTDRVNGRPGQGLLSVHPGHISIDQPCVCLLFFFYSWRCTPLLLTPALGSSEQWVWLSKMSWLRMEPRWAFPNINQLHHQGKLKEELGLQSRAGENEMQLVNFTCRGAGSPCHCACH